MELNRVTTFGKAVSIHSHFDSPLTSLSSHTS